MTQALFENKTNIFEPFSFSLQAFNLIETSIALI